jgi:exodeoxyribonuclease VII small subunit
MTDSDTSSPSDEIGYADAVAELDEILAELDDEGIDIDVLSELVERAAHLITICRGRISAAQQRVAGIVETLEATGPN